MAIDANRFDDSSFNKRLEQAVVCAQAIDPNRVSSLLDMLPAVFQEDRSPGSPNFLGRLLLGFEQLLLGFEADRAIPACAQELGLEQTIAALHRYFEPGAHLAESASAPPEFLHWLAAWVALNLREDWKPERQRRFIAEAVPLYRRRGTRSGVEDMLQIYTEPFEAKVYELPPLQIGVHSSVGVDTVIDGGAPFFFRVLVNLPDVDLQQARLQEATARAIVDLQKPAHTFYALSVVTPTFQIGVHSKVGIDTLLN